MKSWAGLKRDYGQYRVDAELQIDTLTDQVEELQEELSVADDAYVLLVDQWLKGVYARDDLSTQLAQALHDVEFWKQAHHDAIYESAVAGVRMWSHA